MRHELHHSALKNKRSVGAWITARFRRLMTPIVPFLAVWSGISIGAGLLGVDHSLIRAGSFAVVTPLWFLAVYLVVILAVAAQGAVAAPRACVHKLQPAVVAGGHYSGIEVDQV